MAEPQPQTAEQKRLAFERQLDQAQTRRWSETPDRLRSEVSPLVRFIATPELQQSLTTAGEDLELIDRSAPVTPEQVGEYYREAMHVVETQERLEVGQENVNAYHNADHTRQTVDRTMRLILDVEPKLSANQARAALIAAAFHDAEHPGMARRPDPEQISVEQHSARLADAYARDQQLTLLQRVEVQTAIVGTSFWDAKLKPYTQLEKLVQLADLGGYMENLDEWVEQSLDVAAEFAKLPNPPDNVKAWLHAADTEAAVEQWLKGQAGFIEYFLRPAHNAFKAEYITSPATWHPEVSLQEKEEVVAQLLADIIPVEYQSYQAKIISRLEQLRLEHGPQAAS